MSGKRVLNILTGDYVINSPAGRLNRPWNGELSSDKKDSTAEVDAPVNDPLAPGAVRKNGDKMPMFTSTYVFRNDFPVMNRPDEEEKLPDYGAEDLLVTETCRVSHVLVYSPEYDKHFDRMSDNELKAVFKAWNDFFEQNKRDFEYIQIFENKGPEVGSSLLHPHCQMWSTKFLPTTAQKMLKNQEAYYKKHKSPMLIDYLEKELKLKERIILEMDHFVILTPFWAYWPYEVMILPRRNFQAISDMSEAESLDFMHAIQMICKKYISIFETQNIPYVMGLRNPPTGSHLSEKMDFWTFHVNFYPPLLCNGRKKFMAGYELFAEVQRDFDTAVAAERLRDV